VSLLFLARAKTDIRRIENWWRANRFKAPDLFERELSNALSHIVEAPKQGQFFQSRPSGDVYRRLLARTKKHVYYAVQSQDIVVLRVCSAQMPPPRF